MLSPPFIVSIAHIFIGIIVVAYPSATTAFNHFHTNHRHQPYGRAVATLSLSMSTETAVGPEIEVISKPDKEFLEKKGVFSWGTWGCGVSKFPWTYDSNESCYLLNGQVTVTPTDGRQPATFGAGDFVTFPSGMSCTWDVSEAVQKHFMFF
jgi:uncharacterized protein